MHGGNTYAVLIGGVASAIKGDSAPAAYDPHDAEGVVKLNGAEGRGIKIKIKDRFLKT